MSTFHENRYRARLVHALKNFRMEDAVRLSIEVQRAEEKGYRLSALEDAAWLQLTAVIEEQARPKRVGTDLVSTGAVNALPLAGGFDSHPTHPRITREEKVQNATKTVFEGHKQLLQRLADS